MNDIQLECIIEVDIGLIHYKGAREVRTDMNHVTVCLNERYTVDNEESLRRYNVSTTPYVHQFCNAIIVSVKGLKQE